MSNDIPSVASASSAESVGILLDTRPNLPNITFGTSEEYLEKTASAVSRAMLPSPAWKTFFGEGLTSDEQLLQQYRSLTRQHLVPSVASGLFILEAGDFAACAAWFPPGSYPIQSATDSSDEVATATRTVAETFQVEVGKVIREHLYSKYGQEFWNLGVICRDPAAPAISGAVRAVLQPVMDKAAVDGKPIWLVTTNPHARDMYLHLGWQVVEVVTIGGLSQWCMMLYPRTKS